MTMWMYERVEPRATKQITVSVYYDTEINQLLLRADTFAAFDILCRGKKVISHHKFRQDRDGTYRLDISSKTVSAAKPIQISVLNKTDYVQTFDGWFSTIDFGHQEKAYPRHYPIQDPYADLTLDLHKNYPIQPLSETALDVYANSYGTGRLPEETDDELSERLKRIISQPNFVFAQYVSMQVSTWNDWNRSVSDIKVEQNINDKSQFNIKFDGKPLVWDTLPPEDPNKATQSGQWHYEQKLKQDIKQCVDKSATKTTVASIKKTISDAMTKAFKSFVGKPNRQSNTVKHCDEWNSGCEKNSCSCHCSWCRDIKKYRSIA